MKSLSIFASPLFTPSTRNSYVEPEEVRQCEILFSPPSHLPPYASIHGAVFVMAEDDTGFDSSRMIAEQSLNVIITPFPNSDGILFLDFGVIEASAGRLDTLQVSQQTLTIHNLNEESISWLIKIKNSSEKFNAFTFSKRDGEIFKGESCTISVQFASEASGKFESTVEIFARKADTEESAFSKVGFILLNGQAHVSSISGLPDSIDFGCVLVSEESSKSFTATNLGNFKSRINFLAYFPFSVTPDTVELAPRTSCTFSVSFKPSESGKITSKLHILNSNKYQCIILNATGGTAELVCDKFQQNTIDFGFQMEDTISWISLYLTNKGTLPLAIEKVTSNNSPLLRLKFVGVTNTVSNSSSLSTSEIFKEKDLWCFVRRRISWIVLSKDMKGISSSFFPQKRIEKQRIGKLGHKILVLSQSANADDFKNNLKLLPRLQPYHSYHFKLGYRTVYGKSSVSDLVFSYKFDDSPKSAPIKSLYIRMKGSGFRPLEFIPKVVDFGLVPIQCKELNRSKKKKDANALSSLGIVNNSSLQSIPTQIIKVINFSFEHQDFYLRSIHSDYVINNRRWSLSPGMKVEIPVEFHPTNAQVQIFGNVAFRHQYGENIIFLAGTGGSAEWSSEDSLDWGNIKIGSKIEKSLCIKNVGYLPMNIELDIIQSLSNYKFVCGDPLEYRDTILPGKAVTVKILLDCQHISSGPHYIQALWQKNSNTEWIAQSIALKSKIGVPGFKLNFSELDFGTVYIDTEKTLPFKITNNGNAICMWTAHISGSYITLNTSSGQIDAGEVMTLYIKFSPKTYDSLKTQIMFETDAGVKNTTCYGVVGVPYLKIPPEHMHIDFGISSIGKARFKPVTLLNTGHRAIEFQFTIFEQFQDKIPLSSMDFDIFYFEPSCGTIPPGETFVTKLFLKPRVYLSSYELNFNVSTKDGESYSGVASGVGGKGIAKISNQNAVEAKYTSSDTEGLIKAKQEVLFAHIETLKDLIAGKYLA